MSNSDEQSDRAERWVRAVCEASQPVDSSGQSLEAAARERLFGTFKADTLVATANPQQAPARAASQTEGMERGTLVGRYLLLGKIGAGGMGVVYAAHDPELDRKVALKLMLPQSGGHTNAGRARLLREAQSLARLAHPNVVTIHDVGEHDEQVWIAMEFVAGQTLGVWLNARMRTWSEHLRVLTDVARGVAAAHAVGLVHRDLKPDNIMIGDDGRVRVMDFGLAHGRVQTSTGQDMVGSGTLDILRDNDAALQATLESPLPALAVRLTTAGAIQGTPAYMAPEQWQAQEATPATDQFGWCVMAWETLYGERPFDGATVMSLCAAVLSGERRPPPRGRNVPSWLRLVLERGLATDPGARWPTMELLLANVERQRQRSRLRLVAIFSLGLLLALTAVGLVVSSAAKQRAETQAVLARDEAIIKQAFALPSHERGYVPYLLSELATPHFEDARKLLNGTDAVLLDMVNFDAFIFPYSYSADSKRLVASNGASLLTFDATRGAAPGKISLEDYMTSPRLSGDGSTIAGLNEDARVLTIIDFSSGTVRKLVPPIADISDLQLSFTGQQLLASTSSGLHILSSDGASTELWNGDVSPTTAAFAPDGSFIAAGFGDGGVRVWRTEGPSLIATVNDGVGKIHAVTISPQSDAIATSSYDGSVRLRGVDLTPRLTIAARKRSPASFHFSNDGRYAISRCFRDSAAQLWDLHEGDAPPRELGGRGRAIATDFSPDNVLAAVLFDDGTVRLWQLGTHDDPLTIHVSAGNVSAIDSESAVLKFFAPRKFYTHTDDKLALWSLDVPGKPVDFVPAEGLVSSRFFGESHVLTVSTAGQAILSHATTAAPSLVLHSWKDSVADAVWTNEPDSVAVAFYNGDIALMGTDGSHTRLLGRCEIGANELQQSADRRRLAAVCGDLQILLWPALDRDPFVLEAFVPEFPWGFDASFSDEGSVFAASGSDGFIRVWDTDSGLILRRLPQPARSKSFQLSPDGTRLATATQSELRIWSTRGDGPPQVLRAATGKNISVHDFSPDGRFVVTGSRDDIVQLWDLERAEASQSIKSPNAIRYATFTPDGSRVLINATRSAELWPITGAPTVTLGSRFVVQQVSSSAFSPDGQRVAIANTDGGGGVFDLRTHASVYTWFPTTSYINKVSFAPNGQQLLMVSDLTARIYALDSSVPRTVFGRGGRVRAAAVSASESLMALTMGDGGLLVGDPQHRDSMHYLRAGDANVVRAVVCGVGAATRVVAAFSDNSVRGWDLASAEPEPRRLFAHDGDIRSLACSPDGRRLVSTADDRTARWIDLAGDGPEHVLSGHNDWIYTATFSGDDSQIVTASADHTAQIWRTSDATAEPRRLSGHTGSVTNAIFSPDDTRVLTLSLDHTAKIWDASSSQLLRTFAQAAEVGVGAWTPDGQHVALAAGTVVQVWAVDDEDDTPEFTNNAGGTIRSAEFSRDGDSLLSAAEDGTLRVQIWNHSTLLRTISASLPNCLPSEARERLLFEDPTQAQGKHAACQASRPEI